jgi:hypothetical protein
MLIDKRKGLRSLGHAARIWIVISIGSACATLPNQSNRASIWYEQVPARVQLSDAAIPVGGSQTPLGSADRVVVRDGHFYTVGLDRHSDSAGERRVRFFGVSLALSANFPTEAAGEALADRLAALGVNIVRLHAIDQPAGHDNSYPVGVLADAGHPELDLGATNALRRFISQLGQHGIYVDLNLHVNHTFPAQQLGDQIPPQSKPLQIFDADMISWQERYTRNLLSALDLRNTPGLALVEINNESTLIDGWQEGTLPTLVTGRYRDELAQQWARYQEAHHLESSPLPLNRTGLSSNDARAAANFFVDLDQRYIARIAAAVRSVVGNRVPVSGTQIIHSGRWNHGGFVNFDIDHAANYIDAHFYVDHYSFPERQWDWTNWRISNSWLGDSFEDTLLNTAFARAENQPFVISEFNQAWPNQQGSDLLPIVTQFAVSQDWDGLILYAYSHDKNWTTATPSDFSLKGDWTKIAQFAQCAEYFRRISPRTALTPTVISLSRGDRITAATNNVSGNLANYLSKRYGISPSIAMSQQIQIRDATKFDMQSAAPLESSSYLTYDKRSRQITFGSSYAAGISGYLPIKKAVRSSALELTLAPGSRGFATAFVTSLDGETLTESGRLLLSIPGFTMGTGKTAPQQLDLTGLRDDWWTIRPETGGSPSANLYSVPGPVQMERIPATIVLHVASPQVVVYALNFYGQRISAIPTNTDGKRVTFSVNTEGQPFAASYEILLQR